MGEQIVKYLIDSNIWIYGLSNISEAIELLSKAFNENNGGYSSISKIECLGYKKIQKDEIIKLKNMFYLSDEIIISNEIVEETINLKQNYSIKTPDAIIASSAIVNNLILVTRNEKDFSKIENLKVFNPFNPE